MSVTSVLTEVMHERDRQDDKWGEQNHAPLLWLAILGEEFGEVAKAAVESKPDQYRRELIEVAAVAVAAIESFDRAKSNEEPIESKRTN